MLRDRDVKKLAQRAAGTPSGEITVSVREIRDDYWKTSRLTARDREKIDKALEVEGAQASPKLASGVGLDEPVRITHLQTKREHQRVVEERAKQQQRLRAQQERDRQTARELADELEQTQDRRISITLRELAERFGRDGAVRLSFQERQSIVAALDATGVLSDPPLLASGTSWGDQGRVVLALPRKVKLGRVGRRVLAGAAVVLVLIVVIALIGGGGGDGTDGAEAQRQQAAAEEFLRTTTTTAQETAEPEGEAAAVAAEEDRDYDRAIAAYVALGEDDDANRVRRIAARVVVGRARAAYRDGRYVTARRHARTAIRKYGTQAAGATRVRNQSSRQIQAAADRRAARAEARRVAAAQRRAAARQARAARAAARRAEEAAAAAAAAPDYSEPDLDAPSAPSSGGRPGCDPLTARDGDGDGIVCE